MRTNTRKRNQRVAQRRSTMKRGGAKRTRTNKRSRVMKRGGARRTIRTNKRSRVMRKNRVNKRSLARKTMKRGGARRGSRKTMKAQRGGMNRVTRVFTRLFRRGNRSGGTDLVHIQNEDFEIGKMIDVQALMTELRKTGDAVEVEAMTTQVDLLTNKVNETVENIVIAHEPEPTLMEEAENKVIKITEGIEFLEDKKSEINEEINPSTRRTSVDATTSEMPAQDSRSFSNGVLYGANLFRQKQAIDFVLNAAAKAKETEQAAIDIATAAETFTKNLKLVEDLETGVLTDQAENIKKMVKILYVTNAMMDYMNAKKYGIFKNLSIKGLTNLVNTCLGRTDIKLNDYIPGLLDPYMLSEYETERRTSQSKDPEDLGPAQSLVLSAVFDKLYNDLLPATDAENPYVTMINPATVAGKFKIAITEAERAEAERAEAERVAAAEAERVAAAAADASGEAKGVASSVPPPRPLRPREIKIVNAIPDGHEEIKPTSQEAIMIGDTQKASGTQNLHLIDLGAADA